MSEKIRPEQITAALEKSRRFEHSWRVYSHPSEYSDAELKAANKFILGNKDNFETMISCPPDPQGWEPEVFDKVFAGLFHTNIRYPKNFTERDFKEN